MEATTENMHNKYARSVQWKAEQDRAREKNKLSKANIVIATYVCVCVCPCEVSAKHTPTAQTPWLERSTGRSHHCYTVLQVLPLNVYEKRYSEARKHHEPLVKVDLL